MKIKLSPAIIGMLFSAASTSSIAHSSAPFTIQLFAPHFSPLIDSQATSKVITLHAKWAEGTVCLTGGGEGKVLSLVNVPLRGIISTEVRRPAILASRPNSGYF